ncbi:porin [Myroides sp. LJL116]
MRKIIFFVAFICLSTAGYAQHREDEDLNKKLQWDDEMLNIMLDTRYDFRYILDNGKNDNKGFHADILKVLFVGDITPKVHYRLRQRLNKDQSPDNRDGLSSATDQAWISFDFAPNWNVKVGMQSIQFGTFEYNYNSADVYTPTTIYNDLTSSAVGVNVSYQWKNQVFNAQIINSPYSEFSDKKDEDKTLAYNVLWVGSLFDGVYKTRWGYGLFEHTDSQFYNWFTVGNQINVGKFTTELDYYIGDRQMDYNSIVSIAPNELRLVEDQAVSAKFEYNFGKWRPFIKGVYSQRFDKELNAQAYNVKGGEAVVEFYPFTSELLKDLRFHTAYSYTATEFKNEYESLPTKNETRILVGIRWLFKVK